MQFSAEVLLGIETHGDLMMKSALRLTGNREAAEDLVQDARERALKKSDLYQEGTSVRAWLLAIQANIFISGKRHEQVLRMESLDHSTSNGASAYCPVLEEVESRFARPSAESEGVNNLGHQELIGALHQSLLPHHFRLIELVYMQGLSYPEAASVLGIPKGTVSSGLSRAKEEAVRKLPDRKSP